MDDAKRGNIHNERTGPLDIEKTAPTNSSQERGDQQQQEPQHPSLTSTQVGRTAYANNIAEPTISIPNSHITNTFCANAGNILNLGGMMEMSPESMSFINAARAQGNGAGLGSQFISASPHMQSTTAPTFLSTPKEAGAPYLSPVTSPTDWTNPHQYMPISNLHAIARTGFFSPTGQPMTPIPISDNAALWADLTNVVPGTPSMAAVPSRSPFITSEADPTLCTGPYMVHNGGVSEDLSPMKGVMQKDGTATFEQQHRPKENGGVVSKQIDGASNENTVSNGGIPGIYSGGEGVSDLNISYLMNRSPQYNVPSIDANKPLSFPNTVGMQLSQGVDWRAAYGPVTPSQAAFLPPTNNAAMGGPNIVGRNQLGGSGNYVGTGPIPMNYMSQEHLEAAKAFQSLEDERVWMDWENGKLDGRLIDTVLHAKSLIEQMLNEFSVERASEVLRAASTLLGRTHQIDTSITTSGGALPSVKLVHPDEFKNPSTFLQIYGDPLCFTKNGSLPKKGRNGNWECSKCSNVNFPRRFRCNMCSTTRDEEGDWVVCEYARQVYERYLSIYKNQQKPGQQQSLLDGQISGGLHPSPQKENSSTMSGHQDILIPTSGAMGPGGGLFNFPVIGPPAQRPTVSVPQQQQLQPQQHSHKQPRASNHNNNNNSKYHQQRQTGPHNTSSIGTTYQNANPSSNSNHTTTSTGNGNGIGNISGAGSRQAASQNRRSHQDDESHARTQNQPHTYAEIVSGERGGAIPTSSDNPTHKVASQQSSQAYGANYTSIRQGGTARGSKNGTSTQASHQKQQQPVA